MSSILFSLPELFESYKTWVSANPLVASDFETTTKWVSYFIAGRINNSNILSELVYCLSNLLVLFNDRIINSAKKLTIPKSGDKLKVWLTVLEYSEVFIELSAKKVWGEAGKWIIVVILQTFKCISRIILLYKHKESIIQTPPVPSLKRKVVSESVQAVDGGTAVSDPDFSAMSFTLKRSGRIIRKADAAPPILFRTWKPLKGPIHNTNVENLTCPDIDVLTKKLLVAETLYVLKPLVHLGAMSIYGTETWKPWMSAFIFDMTSMYMYHKHKRTHPSGLSHRQQLEMSRRSLALLLYLLRSPAYENWSRERIQNFLKCLANNVPLVGYICNPLVQYLPHWQNIYFYMWST